MEEADELGLVELGLLAENVVHQPVKSDLIAYCPTLDLLALATQDERLYVYRLNGQRVVGAGTKTHAAQVQRIRWKPNGAVRHSRSRCSTIASLG